MLLAQIRATLGKIFFDKQPRKMAKFDLEQKFCWMWLVFRSYYKIKFTMLTLKLT